MNKEEVIYPSMVIRSQAEAIELLEQENKKLKEDYAKIVQNNCYTLELEKRIDKAIEYIENNDIIDARLHNPHKNYGSVNELYQILKGDSNE